MLGYVLQFGMNWAAEERLILSCVRSCLDGYCASVALRGLGHFEEWEDALFFFENDLSVWGDFIGKISSGEMNSSQISMDYQNLVDQIYSVYKQICSQILKNIQH